MIINLVRKILRLLSRFTVVLFILFVVAVVAFVWSYMNYQKAKTQLNAQGGQQMSQQDINRVTRSVAKLIVLPEGDPTVAVIQDVSALANQPFFKNAQNGDIVLVYPNQAIIYSAKRHVLVNVGPVVNNNPDATADSATAVESKDSVVEIRNGSNTAGKAGTVGDEIDALAGYSVASTTNAKNKEYASTVIVNLKNKDVSALETKFGVKAVTAMPAGEATSQADIVVILGNK